MSNLPCSICGKVYHHTALDDAAICGLCREDARIREHAPALLQALRMLVAADNCGYLRETMRYCGLFEAGREAILAASGERLWGTHELPDSATYARPLDLPTAAQALLERLDCMTTEAFARGEEQAERCGLIDLICCVVPLASFAGGSYYARYGLPFALNWRGFGRRLEGDEE